MRGTLGNSFRETTWEGHEIKGLLFSECQKKQRRDRGQQPLDYISNTTTWNMSVRSVSKAG